MVEEDPEPDFHEEYITGVGRDEPSTVSVSVSTTDDEGIRCHDKDTVEVEIPPRGVLIIEGVDDGGDLAPNKVE